MKRKIVIGLSLGLILGLLLVGVSPVIAAKPDNNGAGKDVIALSNGFPSGPHFNLNLHGRDLDWTGSPDPGGNSVYVGITGDSTIEYVSNKLAKNSDNVSQFELYTIDPLAECFDGDPARVYLPYNLDANTPAGGYYVFGRILAKPNNGSGNTASSMLVWPTFVVQSANCTGDENAFGDLLEDPYNADLALGLITSSGNLYGASEVGFERFPDPEPVKGKGKSKAVEITQLFKWSGYVTDNLTLDTNGPEGVPDGYLNEYDVPIEYDWIINGGNGNDVIDEAELINWFEDLEAIGEVTQYTNEWIFDIADLVITGQTFTNDGSKLFQIRFYPVETSEFESQYIP